MTAPNKQPVLGVDISVSSYKGIADACRSWIARRGATCDGRYICVTSVHGIMTAFFDHNFRAKLNGAVIATPDGMPVVWALRSFGFRDQQRVYGPDLMLTLCEQAAHLGHRIFLYGSKPDTLSRLEQNLTRRWPDLKIVGMYSPPFRALTQEEDEAITKQIVEMNPDLIFVGLSTPKQESWMAAHAGLVPGIMIGVGAGFDFHAGTLRQAPRWMQGHGLEWFFRLMIEPRRLWKRYLLITPLFLPLWAMQKVGVIEYGSRDIGSKVE